MKRGIVLTGLLWMTAGVLAAQQPAAKKSCTVAPAVTGSPADEAFAKGDFAGAEALYTATPASDARTLGMLRAELGQRKLGEALQLIQTELHAHPDDPLLLDGLGEVRFRRGEVDEAAQAYNRSLQLDSCAGRTHFDVGRYMNLAGRYGSSQAELETAHKLSPSDPVITRAWTATHRVPLTTEERIARLKRRDDAGKETDEQKAATEAAIKALETHERGDCQVASPADNVKIPLWPTDAEHAGTVGSAGSGMSSARSAGVDVSFNGQRRRLTLDTGAGGIVLTHDAAKALGLTPESESRSYGIGDEGLQRDFLSHVDEIRVGNLVLHNCLVRVFAEGKVLHGQDGLLGADVFRSFLVTLDFPASQMRLSPLPKRPDEADGPLAFDTDDDDTTPKALADSRRDRYVAPEMKDWTRVFRSGHDLIFPTVIGNAPSKLFIMDTGASIALISPEAAREVTHVSADPGAHIRGVSGEVKNVMGTGSLSIAFGGVRQETFGMTSVDTSGMSRSTGTEIAGFIGFMTLRELVIQIDYRDNLVHLSYTPHLGSSAR